MSSNSELRRALSELARTGVTFEKEASRLSDRIITFEDWLGSLQVRHEVNQYFRLDDSDEESDDLDDAAIDDLDDLEDLDNLEVEDVVDPEDAEEEEEEEEEEPEDDHLLAWERAGSEWVLNVYRLSDGAYKLLGRLRAVAIDIKIRAVREFPLLLEALVSEQRKRLSAIREAHEVLDALGSSFPRADRGEGR